MIKQDVINFINSQLIAPLTLLSKLRDVLFKILDFITESTTDTLPMWTSSKMFKLDGSLDGLYCKHPDDNGNIRLFETKVDDNINHEPPTDPGITEDSFWKEVSPSSGSAIKEWGAGIYGSGLIIVFHNHSVYGRGLFQLIEAVRPFNSVNIESETSTEKWARLHPTNELITVDPTPANITLDMKGLGDLMFNCSAPIDGNKNIFIINDSVSREIRWWRFPIDAAGRQLTFEADVSHLKWDGTWNAPEGLVWEAPAAGSYELVATKAGSIWNVRIHGPF